MEPRLGGDWHVEGRWGLVGQETGWNHGEDDHRGWQDQAVNVVAEYWTFGCAGQYLEKDHPEIVLVARAIPYCGHSEN